MSGNGVPDAKAATQKFDRNVEAIVRKIYIGFRPQCAVFHL
jgi:hypothetical protein